MKLKNPFKKNESDIIDKAVSNLKKKGVSVDESSRFMKVNSRETQLEVKRIYIKENLKEYEDYLGDEYDSFESFMIEQFDAGKGTNVTLKLLKSKFNLPPKELRTIYKTVMRKSTLMGNYTIAKERKATHFKRVSLNEENNGKEFPIDEFTNYVDDMAENLDSATFFKK